MAKHLGIGFLTAFVFLYISLFILSPFLEDYFVLGCTIATLFVGLIATCTSMILEKLDTILELTAAQSAKLRSLEAKEVETKPSPND